MNLPQRFALETSENSSAETTPGATSAGNECPDSQLLRLEADYNVLVAAHQEADKAIEAAIERLPEWARFLSPVLPRENIDPLLMPLQGRAGESRQISLAAIREFNRETEGIVSGWRDMGEGSPERAKYRKAWIKRREEGRERVRWWKNQRAAINTKRVESGVSENEERYYLICEQMGDIEGLILGIPAIGFRGIGVKLRLMRHLSIEDHAAKPDTDDDFDWQYKFALSALRDAERLTGDQERSGGPPL